MILNYKTPTQKKLIRSTLQWNKKIFLRADFLFPQEKKIHNRYFIEKKKIQRSFQNQKFKRNGQMIRSDVKTRVVGFLMKRKKSFNELDTNKNKF